VRNRAALTDGPVGRTLARMTAGMLVGHVSMVAFNLTDTYFVSRLGTGPLAAMSFTLPVVFFFGAVVFGLATGASSVISRAIGQGDHHRVQRLTTHVLILAVATAAAVSLAGMLLARPLFHMMGARGDVLEMTLSYMRIWFCGAAFMVVPMVGNHAIRATGDAAVPGIIMSAAALMNLALDPLLIFGCGPVPALGIAGAAWATILSRLVAMVASLSVLHFRKRMIALERPRWTQMRHSWGQLLYVGLPAAGTNILMPITMVLITRMVAGHGTAAVAAAGAGNRVDMFALMIVNSLGSVLMPFVGQNWGAGRFQRIREAHRRGQTFALAWGVACMLVIFAAARPIAHLFSRDAAVVDNMVLYLHILPIGYGLMGVMILVGFGMNGINQPVRWAAMNAVRMLGLILPMALLGGWLFGLGGIFAGIAAGNIAAGLLGWAWLRRLHAMMPALARADAAAEPAPVPAET